MASASRRRMCRIQNIGRLSAWTGARPVRRRGPPPLSSVFGAPPHRARVGAGPSPPSRAGACGAHHLARVPFHDGDRLAQAVPAIFGQPLGEQEIAVNPYRGRCVLAAARGQSMRGGLAQRVSRDRQEQSVAADGFRNVRAFRRAEAVEQRPAGAAILLLLAEEQAQLGVPVPGVRGRRVGLQAPSPSRGVRSSPRPFASKKPLTPRGLKMVRPGRALAPAGNGPRPRPRGPRRAGVSLG